MLASMAGWRRERYPRLLYGVGFLCLLSIGITMSVWAEAAVEALELKREHTI